ncbi:hypothetical protein, partial [Photorhabdus laumondii]|uniref:hypothetical protein n=1 Tax=Photorhabdus laumondii TaxID=2218628 RepID=UPI0030828E3D
MTIIDGRCLKVQVAIARNSAAVVIQYPGSEGQVILTPLLHHAALMAQSIGVDGYLPGLSFGVVELQFTGLYRQGAIGEQFALITQPPLRVERQFPVACQLHRSLVVIGLMRGEMQVLALTGNSAL